jgi:methionyl-tRNA formyltransferase
MRIIILTSSPRGIASRVLPELCKNRSIDIAGVVLAHGVSPDRKRNLKRKIQKVLKIGILGALNGIRMRAWYADNDTDDIHSLCQHFGIELTETPFINCDITREAFMKSNADLGLSLGNGYIAKSIFAIPRYGMINVHAEVLPDFQGAQSIIWPIYEKRKETGFTIHQIDSTIDTGAILFQERYPIEFAPVLKDTVGQNLNTARSKIPSASSYVCENYESLREEAILQTDGKSYTTPSIWQFLRIVRNHRALYEESLTGKTHEQAKCNTV